MKSVLIIGGGFSGMMTAINLVMDESPITVTIVNGFLQAPLGVAYTTTNLGHLLNVPAGKMSAFANKPNDFIDWLKSKSEYNYLISDSIQNDFIPRAIYAIYLNELFEKYQSHPKIKWVKGIVKDADLKDTKVNIELENGQRFEGDYLILATGNILPANPPIKNEAFYFSKHYFRNPWDDSFLNALNNNKPVLIIGSGLTMIDCVISLTSNNFKSKIIAVSPRGYIPKSHTVSASYDNFYPEIKEQSLLSIFKTVRKHIKIAEKKNIPWQAVIDSLRPYVQDIWSSFSDKDKQQFISHVRHIWGVARHRLPAHVYNEIQQLIQNGQLEIIGGRINNITEIKDDDLLVDIQLRKQKNSHTQNVSRVINCTGPQTNYNQIESDLFLNLISKKIIVPDTNRLGIKATKNYKVMSENQFAHENIFTIGSLLRGVIWETTAVPELKQQAFEIAQQIKSKLN